MPVNRARVEQAVFDFLRPALKRRRGDVAELTRRVMSSVAQAQSHADSVVNDRRRQLGTAKQELAECERKQMQPMSAPSQNLPGSLPTARPDCSEPRRRVEAAERALDSALQGRNLITRASTSFSSAQSAYVVAVDQLLLRAEKIVRIADERTSKYQQVPQPVSAAMTSGGTNMGDFAAPESVSWRDLPGVSVPAYFPAGFALIPVELIGNDDSSSGAEDFDAGQDVPALRWSAQALLDVVLPAMSAKPDVLEYLRDRDARERLSGERSYGATYSSFFTADSAIRLSPHSDGRFDIVNGRRRLRIMSRAGAQCVPALIGEG